MDTEDIILIGVGVVATYYIYNKLNSKPQDVTTGASQLPSGIPTIERSELNPNKLIFRTQTPSSNTSYFIKDSDLSASEKRAIRYGFYDIEDDKLQYGLFQGVERKLRDSTTPTVERIKNIVPVVSGITNYILTRRRGETPEGTKVNRSYKSFQLSNTKTKATAQRTTIVSNPAYIPKASKFNTPTTTSTLSQLPSFRATKNIL